MTISTVGNSQFYEIIFRDYKNELNDRINILYRIIFHLLSIPRTKHHDKRHGMGKRSGGILFLASETMKCSLTERLVQTVNKRTLLYIYCCR